jgi:hypothetical protein
MARIARLELWAPSCDQGDSDPVVCISCSDIQSVSLAKRSRSRSRLGATWKPGRVVQGNELEPPRKTMAGKSLYKGGVVRRLKIRDTCLPECRSPEAGMEFD